MLTQAKCSLWKWMINCKCPKADEGMLFHCIISTSKITDKKFAWNQMKITLISCDIFMLYIDLLGGSIRNQLKAYLLKRNQLFYFLFPHSLSYIECDVVRKRH